MKLPERGELRFGGGMPQDPAGPGGRSVNAPVPLCARVLVALNKSLSLSASLCFCVALILCASLSLSPSSSILTL